MDMSTRCRWCLEVLRRSPQLQLREERRRIDSKRPRLLRLKNKILT